MSGADEAPAGSGPSVTAGGDDAEIRALVRQGTSGAGHLIRRLFQLRTRIWQDIMPCDLTGPQFTVLGTLYEHGSMDQGTLGQHAGLDKSTAAPIVERLRGRGLLMTRRDTADARRKLLDLTPEGRRMVIKAAPFAAQVDERLLATLGANEREKFFRLVHRVLAADTEQPE
ncbi:MarR family winged helix-turn-helix transcriptional regulator [Actinoallomurus rhizosphaericola]|uniref:MarR family winged helix-turn-helix transcriptional regulator n=1 Tax=Actinoallomurus rhizosphaericola TaxID=2952536 RepID=UPI002092180A|nr:MarR family winged helix-turn-helix transcriptional regulator [Actinoallomurus rhizosphaericola]MCO5995509.1 MarR family winged helix-turn-helix transcriptional regulator [Actinoallomurus rhizosphaericola]